MYRTLLIVTVIAALTACSVNINKSKAKPPTAPVVKQTSSSEGFIQSISLANGSSIIVAEGRLEPRSIGSISVKLYRDLYVGDFIAAVNFARDGTIVKAVLIENGLDKQKLSITTVTAGSGNYLASQLVCVTSNDITLC
ncbi:PliI family lysozyme inhibitor of I-type lysozyme [Shewanella abyssi]|uniref:PliI family lysozyme inhibitor of I-type lysozyme n=1 Tax=Shewanella abyssi TaxID=311789 RepID=UPI00200D202B|nr:PliI family lysozyme inhibitor of I-type lysozyme [Shewanella abyssi]MCL1048840.1 PliI family lysozyme inhibitor of I-type lysozyme [Shewanella abyssi]